MSEWIETSITVISLLAMLVGLFGLIVPIFPGNVIIWLAAFGYGVVTGFSTAGWVIFAVLTLLMFLAVSADNLLMGAGARRSGASWTSIGLGLLAGIVGTLLLPPFGGIIAAPAVIYLLELQRLGDRHQALEALKGLAKGWGLAFVARFGIGIVMILLWGVWVWQAGR